LVSLKVRSSKLRPFFVLQAMEIDSHVDFYGLKFLPGFFQVPDFHHVITKVSVLLFHSFGTIDTEEVLLNYKRLGNR